MEPFSIKLKEFLLNKQEEILHKQTDLASAHHKNYVNNSKKTVLPLDEFAITDPGHTDIVGRIIFFVFLKYIVVELVSNNQFPYIQSKKKIICH